MIDTKSIIDMSGEDWMGLIGKPVTIGAFNRSTETLVIQVTGRLLRVSVDQTTFKWITEGEKEAFYNLELAYGLVSYEKETNA